MKLGEAIYKAEQMAAEAGNENSDASMGSDDDGIVDADFEEVENEDDKKDQSSV
jgi:molecular chaperone DnaK